MVADWLAHTRAHMQGVASNSASSHFTVKEQQHQWKQWRTIMLNHTHPPPSKLSASQPWNGLCSPKLIHRDYFPIKPAHPCQDKCHMWFGPWYYLLYEFMNSRDEGSLGCIDQRLGEWMENAPASTITDIQKRWPAFIRNVIFAIMQMQLINLFFIFQKSSLN